jgi:hypothetical protein
MLLNSGRPKMHDFVEKKEEGKDGQGCAPLSGSSG